MGKEENEIMGRKLGILKYSIILTKILNYNKKNVMIK